MNTSRRQFLQSIAAGASVLSLGGTVPAFLRHAAAADDSQRDTILVVLQLTGGNDGLNTVVPYRHEAYRKARPKLGIPSDQVLKINEDFGFHPAARGLASLLESNKLAIVQGVGYPHPNRSHFESMDIWHSCHLKGGPRATGWLGRFLDQSQSPGQQDAPGLHVGAEKQPLAMTAERIRVPSLASPESFRLQDGGDKNFRSVVQKLVETANPPRDDLLGFLQTSTASALSASERITEALRDYDTPVPYPDHRLAEKFKIVAQLIDAGLSTRVYYLELDGFDTHSQQPAAHAALLQQFGGATHAFVEDLGHHGHQDRVLVLGFSEFGRRVQENASEGTDHGAAAPVFLAGSRVRPGLIGELPSLSDLDDGDLKFHTDFRSVYASLLKNWLRWPSDEVLGGSFPPIDVLKA